MKFIITVDTEADNQWKKKGQKLTLENISSLPRFQALCDKYGFPPTYLITHEVASDEGAVKLLGQWQREGRAEIGAHLHPWTNPPYRYDAAEEAATQPFPSELDDRDLWLKLNNLTDIITKNFHKAPTSYRAGRFGLDARTVDYLLKLNFLVDCSVTPKVSWKKTVGRPGGLGGPDFRRARVKPYYLSAGDVCQPAKTGLLEVPVTIIYTGFIKEESNLSGWFSLYGENIIKSILNKLIFRKKWLRIFQTSLISGWRAIHRAAVRNNLSVLEFMIHSAELMPGGSPYANDEKEVGKIYFQLEAMFELFKSLGITGITLTNFAKNYQPDA